MQAFTYQGQIVDVPAGSGYNGVPAVELVRGISSSSGQVLMRSLMCRVLDIDASQISFRLQRNGVSPLQHTYDMVGTLFDAGVPFSINEILPSGTYTIVALNRSGTTLSNAIAAVTARCQAGWIAEERSAMNLKAIAMPKKPFWKFALLLWCLLTPAYAQTPVSPGMSTARSAVPTACVNPTTFALEACGGGYIPDSSRWQCSIQNAGTITLCRPAPGVGLKLYVVSLLANNLAATANIMDIVYGTGVTCGTGTAILTHQIQFGTNALTTSPHTVAMAFVSPLVTPANVDICIRRTAATSFGATLTGYIAP